MRLPSYAPSHVATNQETNPAPAQPKAMAGTLSEGVRVAPNATSPSAVRPGETSEIVHAKIKGQAVMEMPLVLRTATPDRRGQAAREEAGVGGMAAVP